MPATAGDARDRRARDRWEHTKVMRLEPDVVRWLVDSSGYRRGALARMMGVAPGVFDHMVESGMMTHARIERLAALVRRQPLSFYHKAPMQDLALTDYRGAVVSGAGIGTAPALSPDDIATVRNARWLQGQAGDMLGDLVNEARRTDTTARRRKVAECMLARLGRIGDKDDARLGFKVYGACKTLPRANAHRAAQINYLTDAMAASTAMALGLTESSHNECTLPMRFDALRDAVERHGNALVFQEDMDMETVRSVLIAGGDGRGDDVPPSTPHAIILNAGDAEGVRSFSMLHAYGHVMLGRGGGWDAGGGCSRGGGWGCICREYGGWRRTGAQGRSRARRRGDAAGSGQARERERAEVWCDSFAAAVMMPSGPFARDIARLEQECELPWRTGAAAMSVAGRLAESYQTSMYAAATRAIDLPRGRNKRWYRAIAGEVANTAGTSYGEPAIRSRGRGVAAHCESRRGRRFIRTVLASHDMERETLHDAIVMLGIQLDDIDAVGCLADEWPNADGADNTRTERGGV